jgi:lipoprotein-anchoring transpeptidase ErfK/SrfK
VLAFRKVNLMAWTRRASPEVLSRLLRGRGAFKLRHPGAGRHVEVDLRRQVMVLANKGKPRYTFPISSGKASTPADRGHFRFYRRQPGYNSLGMLHSVYYNGGEAIHGYRFVPTYPASHGCIRSPIPDARFIYDWVRLGMSVYVY